CTILYFFVFLDLNLCLISKFNSNSNLVKFATCYFISFVWLKRKGKKKANCARPWPFWPSLLFIVVAAPTSLLSSIDPQHAIERLQVLEQIGSLTAELSEELDGAYTTEVIYFILMTSCAY
ncbi:hypothetical protein ACJX0J_020701, partial [Zea mays]